MLYPHTYKTILDFCFGMTDQRVKAIIFDDRGQSMPVSMEIILFDGAHRVPIGVLY